MMSEMVNQQNSEEFNRIEGKQILDEHFQKIMITVEILMNQLNMMYYWERLRVYFQEHEPSLDSLGKLINRCLKLYQMIDNFMKIFKMIEVKAKIDKNLQKDPKNETMQEKSYQMCRRLQIGIKLLLKECPVLPMGFKFNG